ncbi:MAG TPA: hypothetical protein VFR43_04210 [Gaiellaceae bacterium]|nr:hypothetical protein [Gaiellaceae bacterium]
MAATRKEQHMNPLIPQKALFAFLFGALALALAAPAGARPILADSELGDAPATVVPAKPDLEHSVLAKGAVAVAPDAFERAVTSQAPSNSGTVVLRKSGTVVVVGDKTTGEPAWLRALNARSEAMNEYYAGQSAKPAWLKALEARSEAMNAYYGAGTSTAVRPDDRANPRPVVDAQTVVQAAGSSSSADDGIAWGDVAAGALGGFGIAFLIGLGGFAVLHSHRRTGSIAH